MALRELLRSARLRGRALFRRAQLDRDLEDEVHFHLEARASSYRSDGLPAPAARQAAERRFGNPVRLKEECRDMWSLPRLETLVQDVQFALRVLRKSPGFTAVAVLSLAVGIGGNAAMFSLVSAVLIRPLPYPSPERLVRPTLFYPKGAVVALQERSRTLEVAGVGVEAEVNVTGQGEAQRLVSSTVSANLFAVLGRGAALGRVFETGEDQPGRDGLVVLSHALWEGRFGSDPSVLGRTLAVEGVARRVVGVMPRGFQFPSPATQIWVPLHLDAGQREDYWGFGWMPLVARLRPGATQARAQDELRAMVAEIAGLFPWKAPNWNVGAVVVPLQEDLVRDLRRKLLVLQAAVGLVLLIACANVASLLLARATTRTKEMALRSALGAGRGRILRQLLTESVVLSSLGGILGLGLAWAAAAGLPSLLPADLRGTAAGALDQGVLAFATFLSVLTGLLFGVAPAASAARVDLLAVMKAGGARAAGPAGARLRSSFIAAELALAVILAVGAGLLIRTLWGLNRVDPGFRPEQTLTVRVSPNLATCADRSRCIALYDELLRRVRELGSVRAAALANALPLDGDEPLLPVELDGHPLTATAVAPLLWAGAVTPGYHDTLHIPVLRGRGIEATDTAGAAPVVLVSAATARRYWPGEDPIGKRIRVVWDADWRTVVGVVGDVRQYALTGRTPADITGALYMPYPQSVALNRQLPAAMALILRTPDEPATLGPRLRALVSAANPDVPVGEVRSLDDVVESSVAEPRSMTWLFAAFAACAFALAAVGTYGVISHSTAQRTYEIGVRVAVGATRADVYRLVMGQSLRLVTAGLAAGVAAALVLARALSSFLYGVSPADPLTFAAVGGLLLITALLAGYLPGRRAAATDPVTALRVD